jgi:hypothetical protein
MKFTLGLLALAATAFATGNHETTKTTYTTTTVCPITTTVTEKGT